MSLSAEGVLVVGGLGRRGRGRDVGMSWEAEGTAGSSLDQGQWVIAKNGRREDISAALWEDDSCQDQTWLHVSPSPHPSRAPGLAKPALN